MLCKKEQFLRGGAFSDISHNDLLQLEKTVEKLPGFPTWDRDHYPDSRKDFTNTGGTFNEGAAVRYTGYVFEAHAADTSGGESVNCDQSGAAPNDVHIALVPDSKATAEDECTSNTAEMSTIGPRNGLGRESVHAWQLLSGTRPRRGMYPTRRQSTTWSGSPDSSCSTRPTSRA